MVLYVFYFFSPPNKLNRVADQHLTFIFHKIFQGLPFHVIWDVADKHPVSFVHVSIGFKAPASASFLGSFLPAGIRFMFGFSVHFSVGAEQLWWSEKIACNESCHLKYKQKQIPPRRPLLARMRQLAASAIAVQWLNSAEIVQILYSALVEDLRCGLRKLI